MIAERPHLWVSTCAIVLVALIILAAGCTQTDMKTVQLGMSPQEVVRLLGEPDRKSVLDGKVLRDLSEIVSEDRDKYRIVYTYEESGLQVWFKAGKATGATRHGISIF